MNYKREEQRMLFWPAGDYIVVKRNKRKEQTNGGIIIPKTAENTPMEGVVAGVGPGRWELHQGAHRRKPIHVKTGDRVLFAKWTNTAFKDGDDEYLFLVEDNIIGVLL